MSIQRQICHIIMDYSQPVLDLIVFFSTNVNIGNSTFIFVDLHNHVRHTMLNTLSLTEKKILRKHKEAKSTGNSFQKLCVKRAREYINLTIMPRLRL